MIEGMSKKTMQIIVFGTMSVLAIIIFMVLSNSMSKNELENNSNYGENKNNVSTDEPEEKDDEKSSVDTTNNEKDYYDFERVSFEEICSKDNVKCSTVIGALTQDKETKILGINYENNEGKIKYELLLDEKEFYKEDSITEDLIEFIKYKSKYLIIVLGNDNKEKRLVVLDENGKKVLEDKSMQSKVDIKDGLASYKTLNCDIKDGYIYEASIKFVNNKLKTILDKNTNIKTEDKEICK